MEEINLGLLGYFPLEDVNCDDDFDSDDEFYEFVTSIFDKYNANIEMIDKSLLYRMYYALSSCSFPIWEKDSFKKIINEEKLPNNFYSMANIEKSRILYGFDFNEDNIREALLNCVPFLVVDNFKNDIKISNVTINKKLKEISIEFEGLCSYFTAMVTFAYDDSFRISEFHSS